jgi:hypothetical protein
LAAGCLIGQALWPNVQPELIEARIMPQISQIIGVNSVTNIELDKGVMPAPIIRNADWFENFALVRIPDRVLLLPQVMSEDALGRMLCEFDHDPYLV